MNIPIEIINVFFKHYDYDVIMGRLAIINGKILFEYSSDFLKLGIEPSPFKLPLTTGATECNDSLFNGIFGIFDDSLPDGWGRLLIDRYLKNKGVNINTLSPLDRLACVGQNGMGALAYIPDYSPELNKNINVNLDNIYVEIQRVLEGEADEVIEELIKLGGSSGGARPKIVCQVSADKNKIIHGQNLLIKGYTHWIIKFKSKIDAIDEGKIEYAYSQMALEAGIDIPETHLFKSKSGNAYFGIKRFDRQGDKRVHMHSACGLLHASHRLPSLDYEDLLKATYILTKDIRQVEKMFRIACFNIYAHNCDDHSRNFSFLLDENDKWIVSPAYDLTYSSGIRGEHITSVLGKGNPQKKDLIETGNKFNLKNVKIIIEQIETVINDWEKYAKKSGISKKNISNYQKQFPIIR